MAFVSAARGLVHMETYTGGLDGAQFLEMVGRARKKMKLKPFALFMDNAPFHKSNEVRDGLEEMNITRIMNVPYSPWYNGIEGCFSVVKNHFKRRRLNYMVNNKSYVIQELIKESFSKLTKSKVQSFIRSSESKLLKKADDSQIVQHSEFG